MNILTIIVLLLLLLSAVSGYRRGFIKTLASMVSFILSIILVYFATPYISDYLKEKTPVYEIIEDKCEEMLGLDKVGEQKDQTVDEAGNAENGGSSTQGTDIAGQLEGIGELPITEQMKIIENLKIPQMLRQELMDNNNVQGYAKLAVDNFKGYIVGYLATLILNILSFVAAAIVVFLVLRLIFMALNIFASLPLIHGLNQAMGIVLGLLQGVLFIWVLLLLITIFSGTDIGHKLMLMVNESEILSFMYNTNFLMKILMHAMSGF